MIGRMSRYGNDMETGRGLLVVIGSIGRRYWPTYPDRLRKAQLVGGAISTPPTGVRSSA